MATHRHLEVTEVGDVTVVRLTDRKVVDETNIQELGRELFALVEEEKRQEPAAEFFGGRLSCPARRLGKLITLEKKVKAARRQAQTQQHPSRNLRSVRHHEAEQVVRNQG